MTSIWDSPGSTGGSGTGSGAGGGGSIWGTPGGGAPAATTAAKSGGGGGLFGFITHPISSFGHYIAHQASVGGHDALQMLPGLATQANAAVIQPWWHLLHGDPSGFSSKGAGKGVDKVINEQSAGIEQTLAHPGRDLFATAMLAAPLLHGVGRVGVGAAEGAGALKAGEGLKGAVKAAKTSKILNEPRTLTPPGGGEPVSLATSRNVLRRGYQAAHDTYVQHKIDTAPESRVAAYGASRMHGTLSEVARAKVRMRQAVVSNLRNAAQPLKGEIAKAAKSVGLKLENNPKTVAQAALELVQHNTTPDEAITRARYAIEHGVNPELNAANAKLYQEIKGLDIVHTTGVHAETAAVNPAFKALARADEILHGGGSKLDAEIAARNLRPEAQLTARRNLPAKVTQELKPLEAPKTSPALTKATNDFQRIDAAHEKALAQEAKWRNGQGPKNARGPNVSPGGKPTTGLLEQSNPYRNRVVQLGIRREAALERLQRIQGRNGSSAAAEAPALSEEASRVFSERNGVPEDVARSALGEIRQQLPPLLQRRFEEKYGIEHGAEWTPAQQERFTQDMLGVHNGSVTDPELRRMYHQLTHTLEGRTFTPLNTLEGHVSGSPMAQASSPVTGLARDPLNKNFTTGKGLLAGEHQADVIDAVAKHWHNVMRFFNTQDQRAMLVKTGSDVSRSSRDILVRVDNRTEAGAFQSKAVGKITSDIEQVLGKTRSTAYTPEMEGEDAGVMASLDQFVNHLRGRDDPEALAAEDQVRRGATGVQAPQGYKWVDSKVVGDKLDVSRPTNSNIVGRFFDNINSAVTAATVYFKLGHFGTRYLTNAATNIMQGSATPLSIKSATSVWHELTPEERLDALSSAGTHYYEALPGAEGTGRISRLVQHGIGGKHVMSPGWWAGYVDAPFRFNSLAYEIRKSAYGAGPEGFRSYLSDLKNYDRLDPAQRAEVDGVVRRANREAIAYDRLNPTEKTYLSRAIWFYPWVKGSTVWTASALFEHPFKSAFLVNTGHAARLDQEQQLGDVPSYSYGVFLLAHGSPYPLVADFNTFNPMGTAGQVLQTPSHLDAAAGMLNPMLGAVDQIAHSQDQYGTHTNHPISAAAQSIFASTPEAQIVNSYLGRHADQSHREYPAQPGDPFGKNWLGETLRMLLGPGTPRRFNPAAAHSLAKRERTGR